MLPRTARLIVDTNIGGSIQKQRVARCAITGHIALASTAILIQLTELFHIAAVVQAWILRTTSMRLAQNAADYRSVTIAPISRSAACITLD